MLIIQDILVFTCHACECIVVNYDSKFLDCCIVEEYIIY